MTLIELAIAFVANHPAVTSAIIGPRTMEQLDSQLPAADVALDAAILDRIDEIVRPGVNLNPADTSYGEVGSAGGRMFGADSHWDGADWWRPGTVLAVGLGRAHAARAVVHGAFHGLWCWDGVVAASFVTVALMLWWLVKCPSRASPAPSPRARLVLEAVGEDVVLFGHSYGGCVISAAAAGQASVGRLI